MAAAGRKEAAEELTSTDFHKTPLNNSSGFFVSFGDVS
jgi:hypothetical protein